jgi:hypothetical protein
MAQFSFFASTLPYLSYIKEFNVMEFVEGADEEEDFDSSPYKDGALDFLDANDHYGGDSKLLHLQGKKEEPSHNKAFSNDVFGNYVDENFDDLFDDYELKDTKQGLFLFFHSFPFTLLPIFFHLLSRTSSPSLTSSVHSFSSKILVFNLVLENGKPGLATIMANNVDKAGLEQVDKDKVNQVINQSTKGTLSSNLPSSPSPLQCSEACLEQTKDKDQNFLGKGREIEERGKKGRIKVS